MPGTLYLSNPKHTRTTHPNTHAPRLHWVPWWASECIQERNCQWRFCRNAYCPMQYFQFGFCHGIQETWLDERCLIWECLSPQEDFLLFAEVDAIFQLLNKVGSFVVVAWLLLLYILLNLSDITQQTSCKHLTSHKENNLLPVLFLF